MLSILRSILLGTVVITSGNIATAESPRCVLLELYTRGSQESASKAENELREYVSEHEGLVVHVYDLEKTGAHRKRFEQIRDYFQLENVQTPAVYSCRYLLQSVDQQKNLAQKLDSLRTVTLYARKGCPKCDASKAFLNRQKSRYRGFKFVVRDVIEENGVRDKLKQLTERYQVQAPNLPAFHLCNELSVGYLGDETTGKKIIQVLDYWTVPCDEQAKIDDETKFPKIGLSRFHLTTSASLWLAHFATYQTESPPPPAFSESNDEKEQSDDPIAPPSLNDAPPPTSSLPPPADSSQESSRESISPPSMSDTEQKVVDVPFFGRLSVEKLGMPAFTFLIGLADGFNPCAMWVLLFLLSVLVNLKSRMKILAVAGTFVLISGLAYYAFMAAWLNIFMLLGYLRPVQIGLGLLAVLIGAIHVKDFFAFKKGISLSIPESAKPGIYRRVRNIVTAHSLLTAIAGATVLAVLVNIVELLCTAGLPALYTQILTMQGYSAWGNYLYLALYILAYMLDDALMVGIVVVTLGRHKLQETQGRWLKLVSGLAIAILGLMMLVKPEWLA